jgi:hypothetical protein
MMKVAKDEYKITVYRHSDGSLSWDHSGFFPVVGPCHEVIDETGIEKFGDVEFLEGRY